MFAKAINYFYFHFDTNDFRFVSDNGKSSANTAGKLSFEERFVLTLLQCINVRKCPGPDGTSVQDLKNDVTHLSGIFTPSFRSILFYKKSLLCGKRLLLFPKMLCC